MRRLALPARRLSTHRRTQSFRKLRIDGLEERRLLSVTPALDEDPEAKHHLSEVASDHDHSGEGSGGAHSHDEHDPIYVPAGRQLARWDGFLAGPAAGDPLEIAKQFLASHASELGLSTADIDTALVTDQYTSPETGTTHIYFAQTYQGLRVANVSLNINISRHGEVMNVGSTFVEGLLRGAPTAGPFQAIGGIAALETAGEQFGLDGDNPLQIVSHYLSADGSMSVWDADLSLDEIPLKQIYVPTADGLVLSWNMVLRTPDEEHWLDVGVAAHDGLPTYTVDWVAHASYNVYPRPTEAPNDGARSIVVDPQMAVPSPFGWHDTNGVTGAEFTDTRGNNVSAQEDADDNNSGGFRPSGGASLDFDFPLDLTQAPSAYQSAAIANLFYWNNLLHDIHYVYGFTEAAGNFQTNNYGRGGAGNDAVQADAQDGSGTNNANFATPPDGSTPRMQQYIFTAANPDRDSSIDNLIIAHEYGHGVSNRLTGGPANSNALSATQSRGMGEGWSDWWGLMLTQKVTDAKLDAYGVGTYALGQASNGPGIRRYRYSFDMAIDPLTFDAYGTSGTTPYGTVRSTQVHNTGEIWCSSLWDMNWLLIDKFGFDPNVEVGYTGPASAGNILALQLVMDALKLQPANPSFADARNAILLADENLTGGANQEQIWTAFARRGMGLSAVVSSSSATSITPAYDVPDFGMRVTSTTPSEGAVVFTPPTDFVIVFSNPYAAATVQASDLLVNGLQASSVVQNNPTTLTFQYNTSPVTTQGVQSLAIASGSILRESDSEPNDPLAGTFRYDATPLQVTATYPANGSTVALPFTTLDVDFNEAYAPASLGLGDLTISQGTVTGASPIDADTVRFTLSGIVNETPLTIGIAAGALTDIYGNPMLAYSGNLATDIDTVPVPTPLVAKSPLGSLVYTGTVSGAVSSSSDTDSYTLAIDAGQSVTLVVDPSTTLQPIVQLLGPGGGVLVSGTATAAGSDLVLKTTAPTTAGVYTVVVSGAGATTGSHSTQIILNAGVEFEAHSDLLNDTVATAQSLDLDFATLIGLASRAAVLGRSDIRADALSGEVEPNGTIAAANNAAGNFSPFAGAVYQLEVSGELAVNSDLDFYQIGTLQAGDIITISLTGDDSGRGTLYDPYLEFYRGNAIAPTTVTSDDDSGVGYDSLIYRFTISATDTYYIKARSYGLGYSGAYDLSVYLEDVGASPATGGGIATDTEPNDTAATASDASTSWRQVNYFSRTSGTIDSGDADVFKYQFNAGDLVAINIDSLSALDARVSLLDAAGNTLAIESGTSSGPGADSPLYAYRIVSSGNYYVQVQAQSGTGTYNADIYLSTTIAPPTPVLGNDYFSLSLAAGEVTTLAVNSSSAATWKVELLDPSGSNVLATGIGGVGTEQVIRDFVTPASGNYLARVSSSIPADYNLVVTRGAVFDNGANGSQSAAQPLGASEIILGATGAGDYYAVNLAAGAAFSVTTSTPSDGAFEFQNTLNPALELYNSGGTLVASDDNSAADGRNAQFLYHATVAGAYYLRVRAAAGSGEYIVQALGAEPGYPPFAVTTTNPVDGALQTSPPTQLQVNFNDVVLQSTLDASDLTINGFPATGVTVIDGDSVSFTLPGSLGNGVHALSIASGAVHDIQGTPLAPFSMQLIVNAVNFAPALDNTGSVSLAAIDEDVVSPAGTSLPTMLATGAGGDPIFDPDPGAVDGIAVYAVDNTNGAWQYSLDSGLNWTNFGSPSTTAARLLASNSATRVRFVPALNFNGIKESGLTFYAWDQTTGVAGNTANVVTRGGTTAYSLDSESVSLLVHEVNDPPVRLTGEVDNLVLVKDANVTPLRLNALTYVPGGGADEAAQTISIQIVAVPRAQLGVVVRAGDLTPITVGQSLSVADLQGLRFSPAAGAVGVDTFEFQVTDNGTTGGAADPRWLSETLPITVNHKSAINLSLDINQLPFNSDPTTAVFINGIAFFTATTHANGTELWRSDGTTAGTYLLKDIYPGTSSSSTANLTVVGNSLYFAAADPVSGTELWKTDGTSEGTVQVVDLFPGIGSSAPSSLFNFNGTLYFFASGYNGGTYVGNELWKSDGTLAGTTLVKDIVPGSSAGSPSRMAQVGNNLFFTHYISGTGTSMWTSDGTDVGTVLVETLTTSSATPTLVASGSRVFFSLSTSEFGAELWASDGTAAGTGIVKDIFTGTTGSSPSSLVDFGGTLFFAATTTANGTELWKSDGTDAGTAIFKEINAGTSTAVPNNLTVMGNTLYFSATMTGSGNELWSSDGTPAGTSVLSEIAAGVLSSSPSNFVNGGNILYFTATTTATGAEIWRTDGTAAGTMMLADIIPGSTSSSPTNLAAAGNRLIFRGNDGVVGRELWTSDGTPPGTQFVLDLQSGTSHSAPNSLSPSTDSVLFAADNGVLGRELWKSNGAAAGTLLVNDNFAGLSSGLSTVAAVATIGSTTYFAGNASGLGVELWMTDGTPAGTTLVKDIVSGSGSSTPANFAVMNGILYFTAFTSAAGTELWRSDGTATGTYMLWDINPGTSSSSPTQLTKVGNQVFFAATSASEGNELWVTDGNLAGTTLVKSIYPGTSSASPGNLTEAGGVLLFSAWDGGVFGTELWKSDGTVDGTTVVKDIYPGSSSSSPAAFLNVNGTLYFRASSTSPTTGSELWRSDGTAAGTVLVKDINPGSSSSSPANLTNVAGTIFFTATTATTGVELWKSDGSDAGTVLVKDITSGANSTTFGTMVALGNRLFFRASKAATGAELWTSDGTASGTILVQDLLPGIADSNPANFTVAGGKLYFTANDGSHGVELFTYADSPPTATTIPDINRYTNPPDTIIDLFAVFEDDITPDDGLSYSIVGNTNPALFASTGIDPVDGVLTLDYAAAALGSSTVTLHATDALNQSVTRSFTVTLSIPPVLQVVSMASTSTGYVVEFDRAIEPNVLNLYDQSGMYGIADATLVGAAVGTVRGSIAVDSMLKKITFVATSGVLAPDTYTLTLRSGINAFKSSANELLDGNGDMTPGGDYQRTFVVASAALSPITTSIPNFSRGPGQAVNLPANSASGIPVTLSNGVDVRSAAFTLHYDPQLLNITAATLGAGVNGSLAFNNTTPGVATISIVSASQLTATAGPLTLLHLTASVPSNTPYGANGVLDITDLVLTNANSIPFPTIDDDGLHVAAYFGDANGDHGYNSPDATFAQRIIVGLDTGLAVYRLADPILIVDITHNGQIQSDDVTQIQRAIVGLATTEIPANPTFSSNLSGVPNSFLAGPHNFPPASTAENDDAVDGLITILEDKRRAALMEPAAIDSAFAADDDFAAELRADAAAPN